MKQNNAELITAQASHDIAAAHRRQQNGREVREKRVAACMSLRVVRELQSIEVDIGKRHRRFIAGSRRDLPPEFPNKGAPIQNRQQMIAVNRLLSASQQDAGSFELAL